MLLYTKKSEVYLDVSNQKNRVQEIRLFAALIEAGWNLEVNKDQLMALEHISKIKTSNNINKEEVKIDFSINHAKPLTSIGEIYSELIFPEWFFGEVDRDKKEVIIFEGLITKQRIKYIVKLLEYGFIREKLSIFIYSINKHYGGFLISRLLSKDTVIIKFSYNGRKKQFKLYDSRYFLNLSKSKYVICPPGDFVWTYRLFETVMSKSIPIINHKDEHVEKYGLITKTFKEIKHLSDIEYKKIVNKNFGIIKNNICKKKSLESLLRKYEKSLLQKSPPLTKL